MKLLGITMISLGFITCALAALAWWVEANSWRSNGYASDPRYERVVAETIELNRDAYETRLSHGNALLGVLKRDQLQGSPTPFGVTPVSQAERDVDRMLRSLPRVEVDVR